MMKDLFGDLVAATIGATLLLIGGIALIGYMVFQGGTVLQNYPYVLPILIGLVAFPTMIFTILYASRITHFIGVSSPLYAFGMPPGSIRAVLATGFMVLVLIFGVFTLTIAGSDSQWRTIARIAVPDTKQTTKVLLENLDKYPAKYNLIAESKDAAKGTGGSILVQRQFENGDTLKLAQQILTMLATALTAIVGFYFGSRTANEPELSKSIKGVLDGIPGGDLDTLKAKFNNLKAKVNKSGGNAAIKDEITVFSEDRIKMHQRIAAFNDWYHEYTSLESDMNSDQSSIDKDQLEKLKTRMKEVENAWMNIAHMHDTQSFAKFDSLLN